MNNDIYDFSNTGIYKLIEQMQQISRPVVDMVNSTAFKTSMQSVIQQCSIHNEIMQEYFRNSTIENVIKPTLELYAQQMKKIYDIIPTIATQNIYNTMASYGNILREINFDNLKLNDNGTLEYEGKSFSENEIEVTSKDSITNDYFENYSGLVQIDNLKLRKKPNKDSKVIANLDFGSSIEIKNQLGSWLEINYCINILIYMAGFMLME